MPAWAEEVEILRTELTQTQWRLRVIAERYVLATAAASVGVWDWNLTTGECYLDPNIKSSLGYRDHEIPNDLEVWARYIHPDDAEAVMKAAQDTIDGRMAEYVFEHRMLHKNGSVRWFMVRGKVIRDQQGRATRFVGTDTDITERRELERQVRELSNDAQTRIGHDLHDSLGQQLTVLSLKVRQIETAVTDETSAFAQLAREAREMTVEAMQLTEALARGLSPVLRPTGLAASLGHLAEHAERLYGIECHVELPEDVPERLSSRCGNELHRIAQEAVTNSVRHGGAARVDIEGRILNQHFLLNIVDDGRGIDMSEPDSASMGIRIMKYRARHLGGTLTIRRRRGRGTVVVCSCPIPK